MSFVKGFSQINILMTFIPAIISLMARTLLSVSKAVSSRSFQNCLTMHTKFKNEEIIWFLEIRLSTEYYFAQVLAIP